MGNDYNYDIFISFSALDEPLAREIWNELSNHKLKVFWSNTSLREEAGESWFDIIQMSLEKSRHMLLICTDNSMNSVWVKREYSAFFSHCYQAGKRKLIPVLPSSYSESQLPLFLRELQVLRYGSPESLQGVIKLFVSEKNITERKERNEAIKQAKKEAERKERDEAIKQAKEEAERKERDEAIKQAKEEAERKERDEAIKHAKEEAERKERDEAIKHAKEEAERKERDEAIKYAKEEAEQKKDDEAIKQAKEEAEQKYCTEEVEPTEGYTYQKLDRGKNIQTFYRGKLNSSINKKTQIKSYNSLAVALLAAIIISSMMMGHNLIGGTGIMLGALLGFLVGSFLIDSGDIFIK